MRHAHAATRPLMTRADETLSTTQATQADARATATSETTTAATTQAAPFNRTAVNAEIRSLATIHDLGSDWANGLIDRGATEGEARAAALEALRTRGATTTTAASLRVVNPGEDPAAIVTRMAEATYATRINPRHQLSEAARPFAGLTTLDMARECLRLRGVSTTGLAPGETITRALTTSDFPAIFADTANRTLRGAYTAAPAVLRTVARQTTARDFRARMRIQAADLAKLEKVGERGEYKYSGFVEAKESYAIGTYGTIIALSRQAIINDDLSAFGDMAGHLGTASAEFEAQFLVDLLVANSGAGPTMSDNNPVFHASHGNLASSGAALSIDTLSAARLAMRRQKGINGRVIETAPRYLIVPPELETLAEKILASVQPTQTEDVNPFAGKLELLVEARLANATRWYVAGDPARAEGMEYAYLQGAEGPQTETRAGFEVDGVETKVRLDFGAAFLDWRAWFTNPGA